MPERISVFDPEAVERPEDHRAARYLGLYWRATGHVTPKPVAGGSSTWDITDSTVEDRTFIPQIPGSLVEHDPLLHADHVQQVNLEFAV